MQFGQARGWCACWQKRTTTQVHRLRNYRPIRCSQLYLWVFCWSCTVGWPSKKLGEGSRHKDVARSIPGREQKLATRKNGICKYLSMLLLCSRIACVYYPHVSIGKVFCVCMFVRLRISTTRIKLAASNYAGWFISVLDRESPILGNFAPPEAQTRTNRPATGKYCLWCISLPIVNVPLQMRRLWNIAPRVDVRSACVDRG